MLMKFTCGNKFVGTLQYGTHDKAYNMDTRP